MKRVYIIHGWGGNPHELVHQLLTEAFRKKGFEVIVPQMPDTNEPKIETWISHLQKLVTHPDSETYFIGHSIGCQTVMRYLETLPSKTRVGPCIFIAGWFNLADMENEEEERIAAPWIERPIQFDKIKSIAKKFNVYLSTNEPYGYVAENSKTFKEQLGATVHLEKNMGHFTGEEGKKKLSTFVEQVITQNT